MANIVVGMLEGGYPVGVPRAESLGFLRFFGQRRKEVSRIKVHNVQNGTSVLFPQANARALVLIAVPAAHTNPSPTNRSPSFPSFHLPLYPHGYLVLQEESSSPPIRQPKNTKRSRVIFLIKTKAINFPIQISLKYSVHRTDECSVNIC